MPVGSRASHRSRRRPDNLRLRCLQRAVRRDDPTRAGIFGPFFPSFSRVRPRIEEAALGSQRTTVGGLLPASPHATYFHRLRFSFPTSFTHLLTTEQRQSRLSTIDPSGIMSAMALTPPCRICGSDRTVKLDEWIYGYVVACLACGYRWNPLAPPPPEHSPGDPDKSPSSN